MHQKNRLEIILKCSFYIHLILTINPTLQAQSFGNVTNNHPAMVGVFLRPSIHSMYRNLWPSVENNFVTIGSSAEMHVKPLRSSFGINYSYQRGFKGGTMIQQTGFQYAYSAKLNEKTILRFGITAANWKKTIDWNKLGESDQLIGKTYRKEYKFGGGLGLVHDSYFIAYTTQNFNKANSPLFNVNTTNIKLLHFLQTAYLAKFKETNGLVFDLIAQNQADYNFLQFRTNYYNRYLRIGAGINNGKNYLAMIGTQFRQFRLSYLFETNRSILTNTIGSSHEIQFSWSMQTAKGSERECPSVIWNGF